MQGSKDQERCCHLKEVRQGYQRREGSQKEGCQEKGHQES